MFIPRETIMCQTPPTHLTIQVHKFFFYALMFIPRGTMVPNSLIHSDSRTWGQSNVLRIRVGWLCAICANFVVEILKSWFYHVFFLCCNMWFWFNFEIFYLSFKIKFEYLVSLFNIKLKCLISFFEIKFECLVSPWERLCFCWTLSLSLLSTCDLHCGLGKHLIHIFEESTFWDFVRVCTLALSMRSLHCDLEKEMIYTNLRKHHQLPSHPSSLHWQLNIEYCISYRSTPILDTT